MARVANGVALDKTMRTPHAGLDTFLWPNQIKLSNRTLSHKKMRIMQVCCTSRVLPEEARALSKTPSPSIIMLNRHNNFWKINKHQKCGANGDKVLLLE